MKPPLRIVELVGQINPQDEVVSYLLFDSEHRQIAEFFDPTEAQQAVNAINSKGV